MYETVILKEKREYENPQHKKTSKKDSKELRSDSSGAYYPEFKTGKIDYKKYSKPEGFDEKERAMKIAETAFLGKYQDSKKKIVDSKVVEIPRARSTSQL